MLFIISFNSVQNYTTLKLKDEYYKTVGGFNSVQNYTTLKPVSNA